MQSDSPQESAPSSRMALERHALLCRVGVVEPATLPGAARSAAEGGPAVCSCSLNRPIGSACQTCRRWLLAWSHRDDLLAIARRRLPCADDADDAVAEAMLRAVQFDELDEDRIGAWMTRVLINLCIDHNRERGREPRRRQYTQMIEMSTPTPEDVVVDRAAAATACRRLRGLPPSQQEALLLRAHGLSVPEVAARLGVGYKAAESLLSRGRAAVRLALVAGVAAFMGGARNARQLSAPAAALALLAVAVSATVDAPSGADLPGVVLEAPSPGQAVLPPDVDEGTVPTARTAERPQEATQSVEAVPPHATQQRVTSPRRRLVGPVRVDAAGVPVSAGGVTAAEHSGAWHDQLIRCVLDGPQVSPSHVGCPSEDTPPKDSPPAP